MNPFASTLLRSIALASGLTLSALTAHAQLTVNQTIDPNPDLSVNNSSNSSEFTFTLPGASGIIHDVDISIAFSKSRTGGGSVDPFFNEIGFTLSLGGTSTNLLIGDSNLTNNQATFLPGLSAPSFSGTITFDDEASSGLGLYPVTGTFRPEGSLSVFDGLSFNPGSEFKLTVYDTSGIGGPVIVDNATLSVQFTAVPEPSTYAAAGALALAGLVLRRRMQKKSASQS